MNDTESGPRARRRRKWIRGAIRFLIVNAVFTGVLLIGCAIALWSAVARSLPDLKGWHEDAPASEFTAADADASYTFDDYLAQEERVFEELDALVRNTWSAEVDGPFSRFLADSLCSPETIVDRNWNRSLVLDAESPVGGALMVHGLSDSPYSFRALGERLHADGWTVIWLRVPGHGTCPGALAEVSREDWTAAMRIAARGLDARLPDGVPRVHFGFSNGGALCTQYAAASIERADLPRVDAIVLCSPMIGITSLARITMLYPTIGKISGLDKVAWSKIEPEIDPFKYSSWPMNASVQAWKMTQSVEEHLERLQESGRMSEFPPILAFQSAIDSTVVVPRLITNLFDRVSKPGSELVLYDVNRDWFYDGLIKDSFETSLDPLLRRTPRPFALTIVTNADPKSPQLVQRRADNGPVETIPLDLTWPESTVSLSHSAVPIPATDPILGNAAATNATGLDLGTLNLRGETGVFTISESLMLRLRHNPFYEHLEQRTLTWLAKTVSTGS